MCFKIDGKSSQAAKCVKSRITTNLIDCVLSINTFDKNMSYLKLCYNQRVLKITLRLLVLINN